VCAAINYGRRRPSAGACRWHKSIPQVIQLSWQQKKINLQLSAHCSLHYLAKKELLYTKITDFLVVIKKVHHITTRLTRSAAKKEENSKTYVTHFHLTIFFIHMHTLSFSLLASGILSARLKIIFFLLLYFDSPRLLIFERFSLTY
jgi:hypothetical protein